MIYPGQPSADMLFKSPGTLKQLQVSFWKYKTTLSMYV